MTDMAGSETPLFVRNGSYSLFAVLHHSLASTTRTPVVFCHPFGEEKLWTHRVFVSFARRLARRGHPVLRLDYMGNGDSEGTFTQSSLETVMADVRCGIRQLRVQTAAPAVHLFGLRFGGMVASLVAENVADVGSLILWEPIVHGGRYMQELLRVNLATQLAVHKEIREDRVALAAAMEQGQAVNVDGYELAWPLYQQVSAVELSASPKQHAGPVLIVHVDRQKERIANDLQRLAACYTNRTLTAVIEEPFWKEIPQFYQAAPELFAATEHWLDSVDRV